MTTPLVDPVGGWSNRLNRNISVRTRWTIVFSTLTGMCPLLMSVCSALPKYVLNGCSRSVPVDRALRAVQRPVVGGHEAREVPPVTQDGRLQVGLLQLALPLMVEYAHITEAAWAW